MFSKYALDYIYCMLLLILVRLLFGSPSFLFKLVNLLAFGVYAYDKYQGLNRGYRVAENVLLLVSLLGGWCGAVCAMLIFRHKTNKNSFIGVVALFSVINIVIVMKMNSGV